MTGSFKEEIKNKGYPKSKKDLQNIIVNVGINTLGK